MAFTDMDDWFSACQDAYNEIMARGKGSSHTRLAKAVYVARALRAVPGNGGYDEEGVVLDPSEHRVHADLRSARSAERLAEGIRAMRLRFVQEVTLQSFGRQLKSASVTIVYYPPPQ
jgi:hypothetical protein